MRRRDSPSITGGGTLANLRAEAKAHHQAAAEIAEQVGELIVQRASDC